MTARALEERSPISSMFTGSRRLIGWLLVISFLVYGNTLSNDYVQDDLALITHNTFVQNGVNGLADIWTKPTLRGFDLRPVFDTAASNDLYRPLAISTFAIEHQLVGQNPAMGHLVNVLLFAFCVVLLFRFVDDITERRHTMAAFLTAVLFAVHPIHTEVVANIKSRDELLCFAFSFGALLLFLRWFRNGRVLSLVVGTVLFFISLLAKETSISFLVVVPVLALFCKAQRSRLLAGTALTVLMAGGYLLLRQSVLHAWNADHPEILDFMENPLVGAGSASARYGTALAVLLRYPGLLIIPYPLSADYTFATIPFTTLTSLPAIGAMVLYLALAVSAVFLWRGQGRLYAFAIIFFLATLALVSNLGFLTGSIMAERFLFFPSVGFCMAVAFLLVHLLRSRVAALRVGIPVLLCLVYAPLTIARNADWQSNYTLARADVATHPDNARLHHTLAYVLVTERMAQTVSAAERNELAREAQDHYRLSLEIYPEQSKVHTDYANLLAQMGKYEDAKDHIRDALKIRPGDPVILSMLGGLYFAQGRYDKTLELCREAQKQAPNDVGIMINMAICHLVLKQYDSAILLSGRVLSNDPANAAAKNTLKAAQDSVAAATDVKQPVKKVTP